MIDIEYYGGNAVSITTNEKRLLIDGNRSVFKDKEIKSKFDVVLATEDRFMPQTVTDNQVRLSGPGEYEVGPFWITGIAARRHIDSESEPRLSTIYRIVVDGVRIAVIGNIEATLDEQQQEEIGVIDLLVVPVGGNGYTLDSTSAAQVVAQIDPKVIVPIHYSDAAISYEVAQDALDPFVQKLNAPIEELSKLRIKNAALPASLTIYKLDKLS